MKDLMVMTEEYGSLIEDIKATMTEGIYNYRQTLLETYHEIGKLISSQHDASVQQISKDSGISQRTLERCVQFYKKFPRMEDLPEGKNISWNKVVNLLLPEHKESSNVDEYVVCPQCQGKGKVKI
jgi:hypothetical protein